MELAAFLLILLLGPLWLGSGVLDVIRWYRGDVRVPRARVQGGRPRLRPGLGGPLVRIVLGALLMAAVAAAMYVISGLGCRLRPRTAESAEPAAASTATPPR